MPPPREQQQSIKFLKKFFRSSFFIAQLFAMTPGDLSLDAILVKTPEDLVPTLLKIQAMNHCIMTFC